MSGATHLKSKSCHFFHCQCVDLLNTSMCYSLATKSSLQKKTRLSFCSFVWVSILPATLFLFSLSISCSLIFTFLSPCHLHEIGIWIAQTFFCRIFYFPKWKFNFKCLRILCPQFKSINDEEKNY